MFRSTTSHDRMATSKLLKLWAVAALLISFALPAVSVSVVTAAEKDDKVVVSGAGATFPMLVYHKWGAAFEKKNPSIKIKYRGCGSGCGIAHIKAKTVDFGGTDKPLSQAELDEHGMIQFPLIMGAVTPVVNLPRIKAGELKLSREVLADIFLGKITRWSDSKIREINPKLKLPDELITVVHRADGSGTTFIFTTYLSKISKEWKEKIGAGKSVSWATGVGGKGNPGVAKLVKKTKGSIGYVEFAYAAKNRLAHCVLMNQAGNYVPAGMLSFMMAAEGADWANASAFAMDLTDQKGDATWPILGVSYIMLHKAQPDKNKAQAMLKFFKWCLMKGDPIAHEMDYVPMPMKVVAIIEKLWADNVESGGEMIWTAKK